MTKERWTYSPLIDGQRYAPPWASRALQSTTTNSSARGPGEIVGITPSNTFLLASVNSTSRGIWQSTLQR